MDKNDLIKLRNEIGSLHAVDGEDLTDDNIAIALASYFEDRWDKPEDAEIDDEVGWTKWAIEKTNSALDRIIEHLESKYSLGKDEICT